MVFGDHMTPSDFHMTFEHSKLQQKMANFCAPTACSLQPNENMPASRLPASHSCPESWIDAWQRAIARHTGKSMRDFRASTSLFAADAHGTPLFGVEDRTRSSLIPSLALFHVLHRSTVGRWMRSLRHEAAAAFLCPRMCEPDQCIAVRG